MVHEQLCVTSGSWPYNSHPRQGPKLEIVMDLVAAISAVAKSWEASARGIQVASSSASGLGFLGT